MQDNDDLFEIMNITPNGTAEDPDDLFGGVAPSAAETNKNVFDNATIDINGFVSEKRQEWQNSPLEAISQLSRDENGGAGRISFVLYPKEEIRNINTSFIDLTASDFRSILRRIDNKYIQYATYLVSELDDPGRQEHFATLSAIANRGRLKIDDCITYYVNYKKWKNGQQEDLLPEWVLYVDQNSFRKGSLYELMIKIIQEKVSEEGAPTEKTIQLIT